MTAAIAARTGDGPPAPGLSETMGGAVEIAPLAEVEGLWRVFETSATMTPYGRFDWVAAYQAGAPDTRVAVLRRGGDVVFLMPFQVERRRGLTVASAVGGKHANYNLPLLRPDFARSLDAGQARELMEDAARSLGADMLAIPNMPVAWDGWANPFAAAGRPSASNAWALRLDPDGEATLARSMSAEARKKMRNKARGLAKAGEVSLLRAASAAEADAFLEAYWHQKARRLGELGISDPFSDDALRAFFHDGARRGLAAGRPAIEVHALLVSGEVIAVIAGAADGRRFSGMVVSFAAGALDRFSPGELLVTGVIRDLCARGFAVFDLGVGDARYKRSICDEVEALVDLNLAFTLKGHLAASADAMVLAAKRRAKASRTAMDLLAGARRLKARLRR